MLETDLDFILSTGKRIESPKSYEELCKEYFLIGVLKTNPIHLIDPNQDKKTVFTLKPSVALPYVTSSVDYARNKGYFAWAEQIENKVLFEIFIPHSSVKSPPNPPKQLETIIALFVVRLIQEGYEISRDFIKYHHHY